MRKERRKSLKREDRKNRKDRCLFGQIVAYRTESDHCDFERKIERGRRILREENENVKTKGNYLCVEMRSRQQRSDAMRRVGVATGALLQTTSRCEWERPLSLTSGHM